MSVILVVETDASYAQRISEAMQSAGLPVEVCESAESAVRRAAVRAPRLLIASSAVPEVRSILGRFARQRGGPGSVVMIPTTLVGRVSAHDYHADALLAKPFTAEEVRKVLLPFLAPAEPPQSRQLSSVDIFGDVLAEVASEVSGTSPGPRATSPAPVAAAATADRATADRARSSTDDIDRKLEETLSGVLQPPAAAAPQRRAKAEQSKEIDELLDKTLSSLALETRAKKRTAAPRSQPPTARAAPRTPAAPQAPAAVPTATGHPATAESAAPEPTPGPPDAGTGPPDAGTAATAASSSSRDAGETGAVVFEPPPPLETPPSPEVTSPPPSPATEPRRDSEPATPAAGDGFRTRQMPIAPPRESTAGEIFGDYTLIRRIAVGGMAEVWQARRRGVEGFQKTVAIKKILSHLTGSTDFVTMFIDEAKLAAQLNHNNIIQIYDLGKVGDDFFIAMEYVDGMDLRTILNAARRKRRPLPMGLAVMIASSVARALDYAHRKRDFDNRALGLVHRDISPQNVLISYEGEIKLCDFGIVKAVAKASTTQMGALKGKLQYMSPEQAWGKPVDARSDIFSLGSVLFEMLTGTRLFAGDSELVVLDAVRECRIRGPREFVPRIPEEIDRIVRQALAKTPEERYQTAGEMETDLKGALVNLKPIPSQSELANYMHALASAPVAEGEEPSTTLTGKAERSAAGAPEGSPPEAGRVASAPAPARDTTPVEQEATPLAVAASAAVPAPEQPAAATETKTGRPWVRLLFAAALLVAVIGVVLFFVLRSPRTTGPRRAPTAAETPGPTTPSQDSAPAAAEAAASGTPQSSSPAIDLKELVEQEMTRKREELRKEFEAKRRDLEQQLEEAKKAAEDPSVPLPGDAAEGGDPTEGPKEGGGGGSGDG